MPFFIWWSVTVDVFFGRRFGSYCFLKACLSHIHTSLSFYMCLLVTCSESTGFHYHRRYSNAFSVLLLAQAHQIFTIQPAESSAIRAWACYFCFRALWWLHREDQFEGHHALLEAKKKWIHYPWGCIIYIALKTS